MTDVDTREWERQIAERAKAAPSGHTNTVTLAEPNAELGDPGPVNASVLDDIE